MAKKDSVLRIAILALCALTARVDAQVVETPIPFDTAGHVRALSPQLVTRFGLTAPLWPSSGAFLQARLFQSSTGEHVLVVERSDGTFERHVLSAEQLAQLRGEINSALVRYGSRVGEERTDLISEPARGAFLRNQMVLAAALYGPLAASLPDDAKASTALYLITIGGSYFVLNTMSRTTPVTRAQNDLATDGALRGAATSVGLMRAFGGSDVHQKTYSTLALAGALGGSAIGFSRGRGLTDSEAHAAMKASTFGAGTALGLATTFGAFDEGGERAAAASMVAAGLAGYILGPRYPRRAGYTVTAGDVRLIPLGSFLGAAVGALPFSFGNDPDVRPIAAGATAGWIAGTWLADRVWVRPFDHTAGDVTQTWLGALAGALLGAAAIVLTEPDDGGVILGTVTAGGLLGAIAGHGLAAPRRAQR